MVCLVGNSISRNRGAIQAIHPLKNAREGEENATTAYMNRKTELKYLCELTLR